MKQKILFILPWLPYPLISGGHQALFNGIAAIKDDFDVYLTYEALEGEEYRNAEQGFLQQIPHSHLLPLVNEIKKEEIPLRIQILRKIKNVVYKLLNYNTKKTRPLPTFSQEKWWIKTISPLSPNFLEHVHQICQNNKFDIIQVEMPWMVSQILTLPEQVKTIYVHHELGFVRRELEIKKKKSEYAKACKRFADFNELALLNLYDAIITLSPIDAQKLKDAGVTQTVFFSFATINTPTKLNTVIGDGKTLSFIGPDSHNPNFEGITWFLDNCWAKLKDRESEYHLNIIGKWSEQHIQEYSKKYPNVTFLGFVPDLISVIKGTIMIVPITVGSGIRMKILEACSNGIPFVSTSTGAEGIPVENGKNCFIADNPDLFVEDIIKLQDQELQKQFIFNANKMVKENYSLESLRTSRIGIYREILNN